MDAELKSRLTSRDLWMRALYMVFFVIAYGVAEFVLTVVVIFQFITILLTGEANRPLLKFGMNLGSYVYDVLQYMTFNSEFKPFPFADWPEDEPEDNRWLEPTPGPSTPPSPTADPEPPAAEPSVAPAPSPERSPDPDEDDSAPRF